MSECDYCRISKIRHVGLVPVSKCFFLRWWRKSLISLGFFRSIWSICNVVSRCLGLYWSIRVTRNTATLPPACHDSFVSRPEESAQRFIHSLLLHCTRMERGAQLRDELKGLRLGEKTTEAVRILPLQCVIVYGVLWWWVCVVTPMISSLSYV